MISICVICGQDLNSTAHNCINYSNFGQQRIINPGQQQIQGQEYYKSEKDYLKEILETLARMEKKINEKT